MRVPACPAVVCDVDTCPAPVALCVPKRSAVVDAFLSRFARSALDWVTPQGWTVVAGGRDVCQIVDPAHDAARKVEVALAAG